MAPALKAVLGLKPTTIQWLRFNEHARPPRGGRSINSFHYNNNPNNNKQDQDYNLSGYEHKQ